VLRYVDKTAGPPGGIRRAVLTAQGVDGQGRQRVSLLVRGRGVSYAAEPTAQASVKLDPEGGPCFAARFPGAPDPTCRSNVAGTRLRCE
jgi:hypothetical protein